MRVVFVGAGNLATRLSLEMRKSGMSIGQVYSHTSEHAKILADELGCGWTVIPEEIVEDADLYVFSLKDAVLQDVIARVKPNNGLWVHTAGSMPMDVFRGHAHRYGVLYPMQTFSKDCPVDFKEIPVFVEASTPDVLAQTEQLARSVSDRVEEMSTERRRRLHLAAVFACNFVNHCYALAADVLGRDGIPFDVMWPLIDETARKVHRLPPVEAQTGPAVRYDRNVMDRQCAMLDGEPERKALYEMMSRSIHALALRNEAERKETND